MIRLDNLDIFYGETRVVKGMNLDIARGESFALVGESGSGKSTVLKALAGQVDSWTGKMTVADKIAENGKMRAGPRLMQMVFQDPYGSLHPRKTVHATLMEPLQIHKMDRREERISDVLQAVGLGAHFRFRLPHQLSGGQRQRVAIARALMLEPQILLLDEPTSALDVSVQAEILNLLKSLRQSRGLTYLLVAHDLSVVSFLCDRLAVLRHGEVQEMADVSALKARALTSDYGQHLLAS
ncbi:ABC transporter ATP-binding protein [Ketogulonicigenium vulgare]|uniref:ABC transporter, nucleotide binding/ATPase protein (Oligopeptide) n=1 Tax=Ketogulonicigenium vulgare (strain WSH-001) TaxID=759362 RepID=F9Y3N6_KETVW|nr:ABC transporter ATP-binding protein [Ketogulonicigenium vulgare]ADO42199.1 ABC transporter related protein [Ketogulonicigenium vulgare Y25]AEM40400.1 ABC transporter, nucleotide binding/ATPase protein (Oligopeptide) [Ketogulonicigenium vulgare WSH-001]ALJ80589.1 ABC transporter [Ketogulonicigenium vulgare]ANW33408.1 ABC transporter [Ketogulonicigenium vulgare]AOZ54115.1 ABC transporter [Ketogulonicigenium vulgare]